ncbi:MAG: hypothetical protein CSA81_02370 [Acidobacteria bacterium]|nr:MAG: hypothetical protein CSA81_02370 [Acidobacteriota bacterium]
MDNRNFPGPMTMVKIDGAKIKRLREQQGLTQLYVATSVGVTTDTISRWENRRYPSIKKENGIKLAETLGISLDELLEQENVHEPNDRSPDNTVLPEKSNKAHISKTWPFLLLFSVLLLLLIAFGYVFLGTNGGETVAATRIIPATASPGQVIPVILEIHYNGVNDPAIILREQLPQNCAMISSMPAAKDFDSRGRSVKWLGKVNNGNTYTYLVQFTGKPGDIFDFAGSISLTGKKDQETRGMTRIRLAPFHWADSNMDGIIDDQEILVVYDKYSNVSGMEQEIDRMEKIWLGSGYRWQPEKQIFEITE